VSKPQTNICINERRISEITQIFLMSGERADHLLQPTALVHEAFLKLSEQTGIEWRDRSQN